MSQYRIFSKPRQKPRLPGRFRWLGIGSLWVYRVLTWSVLAVGLVFAGMVLALRHWVLPDIESYRDDIARIVSERTRQKVTIGAIHAQWEGLRPQLVLERVTVHDSAGRAALELSRVDNTLSWWSVPALELRFHSLDIYRPTLNIRRDARDVVSIAGVELAEGGGGNGFADWLLRQRDIEIHDATIVWNDERRKAPQLELKNVHLHLVSGGGRHRFGVRATPPQALAAPLDVRGDLRGDSIAALANWNGRLFVQLDYADIAAWRTWVPFPIEFPRGAGALRAWLTFSRDRLVEAVADVQLASVNTRLAADLPLLDLSQLSGRVGWKQSDEGYEITTSRLGLTTTGGMTLPPADFLLRVAAGARQPSGGEMQASALELAPLVALADHLPLGQETRRQLAEYSPRGSVRDVVVRWTGEWSAPRRYSVRGRFQRLSLNRSGRVPGFNGVTGMLEASERGGTLFLNSQKTIVEMPLVFQDAPELDALSAQVSWARNGEETELWINNVAFSNAHLAGSVFGVYRTAGSARGSIDLTGRLTRADARFVSRYVPLVLSQATRDWLDVAFLAGHSSNVTLRVKGKLEDFPFRGGRNGVFQVTARVTDGVLHYGKGWPDISNIACDLVFRSERMDIHAWQGSILGARLAKVRVEIPDLTPGKETLNVAGEAEGPTGTFLEFIEKSPVAGMIDDFTRGWQAQGAGRLALKLAIPLGDTSKSTIAGTYQFAGNAVTISPEMPVVEQAGGRLDFTNTAVRTQDVKGVLLGGPMSIAASTAREGGVRIDAQGRVNADAARRTAAPQWVQHLRGATDWRATLRARARSADVVIESDLQGLAVNLPAPLAKAAAETWPTRLERRVTAAGQDRLRLSVADIVSMNLLRRIEGERATITRGSVRFGAAAAVESDRSGVWVGGAVKALDLDRWIAMLGRGEGATRVEWGGIDLRLGTLDALGLRFSDLAIQASATGEEWQSTLSGKELDGTVVWQPQGTGKLVARMKAFAIPASTPGAEAAPGHEAQAKKEPRDLPALDIVAEQFHVRDLQLGRLELTAVPEGRDWRLDRLTLVNPEGKLDLDGMWQLALPQPMTQVNLRLEASNVGRLLARLGYPEGVRRGTATLQGSLSWAGAPWELDYSTMSGKLDLEAAKGQFVKLDPGIGKLLGVMNLQSLPRRVTLDFRDVFSEGFAFDEIAGAASIERGTATTESFRVRGPAASVVMSGTVDLAHETQNLRVRITPHLTESVAVAGALFGGPIAGVAAYLAQKALKDPFGQIASYEYDVAGTWSEPTVKRAPRPVVEVTPLTGPE